MNKRTYNDVIDQNSSEKDLNLPSQKSIRSHSLVSIDENSLPWVSASETRNFALGDPLLDWLNLTSENTVMFGNFVQYLMNQGIEFENMVIRNLRERFNTDEIKHVVDSAVRIHNFDETIMLNHHHQTLQYMKNGIPIIYQGLLLDRDLKIVGVPDFLIRSDYLRKIFSLSPLTEDEENCPSQLSDKFHYVVVDCKWSTLSLCADGKHLCNEGSMNAYKCQLAIYHKCLENVQKSGRHYAFIMGKRWKINSKELSGNNCYERLGYIDYGKKDSHYLDMANRAVKWLQDLKLHGREWHIYPTPSRNELYPNMNNTHDDPWHEKKCEIAEKLQEITNVWNCRVSSRELCFQQGIYSWDDPRCCSKTLGINGKILAPVIDAILMVNRSSTDTILPRKLSEGNRVTNKSDGSDDFRFKFASNIDYYIDFEFITMIGGSLEIFPSSNVDGMVYLIGMGWFEDCQESSKKEWKYRYFIADRLTQENEKIIFTNWIDFLSDHSKNRGIESPRLYHWGSAENTWFLKHIDKHSENSLKSIDFKFIDVLTEIKSIPIVFKGAFGFGLKEVGRALHTHGHIQHTWPTINNAIDSIAHINSLQEEALINNKNIGDLGNVTELVEYNETDCRVMAEILECLKNKYVKMSLVVSETLNNTQSDKIEIQNNP